MKKLPRTYAALLAGSDEGFGSARAAGLVRWQEQRISELKTENKLLTRDLRRAGRECTEYRARLRGASETNRKLWRKLHKRTGRG